MSSSVDPHAILTALGVVDVGSALPILGGRDVALFRVEQGTATSALRVYAPGRERQCRFEIQVMQHGAASGLPVPKVRTAGLWNDRPALLMEWLPGRTIADAMNDDPSLAGPLGTAAGRMLAQIHAIQPPRIVQARPWLAWVPIPEPLERALAAASEPPRLLHLDYHPLNLLTDGATITGVLDWANAAAGDQRADLARTITILRFATGELPSDLQSALAVFERGLLDGYEGAAGPLTNLPLFLAWAGHCLLHDLAERLTAAQRAAVIAWTGEREREAGVF